jgi:Ca2+-binding RTX toxin-like protein
MRPLTGERKTMAYVSGTDSAETINAADGVTWQADSIYGYDGDDFIFGLGGDDSIFGGLGGDVLFGGEGTDTAFYSDSDVEVYVDLASGRGYSGTASGDWLFEVENLHGSYYGDWLAGSSGANRLFGAGGNDWLKGAGGVDRLEGGDGDDTLDGGTEADTMIGGRGSDTYIVDSRADVVSEPWMIDWPNTDRVLTSVDYWLPEGHYIEILESSRPDDALGLLLLTGNSFANTIIGDNGRVNHLTGGGGADTMIGRGGRDQYSVDNAGDVVVERPGEGYDLVFTSVSYTLPDGSDIEEMNTSSSFRTDPIDLTGNGSGNIIYGNAGRNYIFGRDGNDELIGNGGNDYFVFDRAPDAASNVDFLSDFNHAADDILLDNAVFGNFVNSIVDPDEFVIGTAAGDANDFLIYDSGAATLYFDRDGNGTAFAQIRFATVRPGTAIAYDDFQIS